jgi:hypothetical protein
MITNAVFFKSIVDLHGQWYGAATILETAWPLSNFAMYGNTSMGGFCPISDPMPASSMADFAAIAASGSSL